MKFNVDYYFEEVDKNEMFYVLVKDKKNVMEIFDASAKIIKQVEESEKQEIYAKDIDDNVKIIGNVYIGEGTKIQSGCIIEGPVYIGKNCQVMYNSYVRPGTIMGNDCVIGFSTEVKHTIMRDGSKISDLAFVGDSILGKNARVGSGVIVANRAFSQSNVVVKDENKNKIDLNREVMGVVLGDNSRIGANSTTSPGTFIGKFTWIYPHTCVHGFIEAQKKLLDKQNIVVMENERKVLSKSTSWNHASYK